MRFLNIRQVICKIASMWDLKSRDFSNLHFVGKMEQRIKNFFFRNFGTTQVINIKLVSLKSDLKKKKKKKKNLCKYIKSDSQLLIFKITLDYLHWTGCGDAHRLCSNEGMFQSFVLVWQTDAFTKLWEPTIRAAQTVLGRHF